ncbi:MAG: branched-chain amino acid transport system ATP-binding protein [Pseudonocardiales bacterium]|jgi:branched-chain amino acid transport system ATP-binding protein|nr:branched-chain amino acid transport system ATP-binding protein [Pseudonocardiales bacterium]
MSDATLLRGGSEALAPGRVEVTGVDVRYGPVTALRGVSLTLEAGGCALLLGPNGAGKSSLLKTIAGFVPYRGTITYGGRELPRHGRNGNTRRGIALVPEGRGTLNGLTVADNLRIGAYTRRDGDIRADAEQWLEFFPALKQRTKQKAGSLSGGEQQMLALARAMMSRPSLLLLDEPSMGLAPSVADVIFERITRLSQEGVSVLIVEQNLARALDVVDSISVLSLGEIGLRTTPAELESSAETRERLLDYL